MSEWILFIIIYAILSSFALLFKKKATEKSSIFNILYLLSLISFCLSIFISPDFYQVQITDIINISIKSAVVVVAWLLELYALSKLPIGLYSIIRTMRIVFVVILGVILFSEPLPIEKIFGIIMVIAGIILANYNPKEKVKKKLVNHLPIILLVVACLFVACSEILDKVLMKGLSVGQMQFWFLLFNTIYFRIILLVKKEKVNYKLITTNYWIALAAATILAGDRFLFYANKDPDSEVSIMVLIKQLSVIVLIILGKIFFKEKNIIKKLICSMLIIAGIVVIFI